MLLLSLAADDTLYTAAEVVVVGTTPLAGGTVPADWLPSNARSFDGAEMESARALSMAEFLARRAPSVHLQEIQGNPLQPDLAFRGFTASPLLGTPQGLAVYVDGVRVNDPFGDTVHWDLLPDVALDTADLLPGSVPAFGLNALGGALVLHTRSGLSWQGTTAEIGGGRFGGRRAQFTHGGQHGGIGWYGAADRYAEDGWRDFSTSTNTRAFGKVGQAGDSGAWSVAMLQAESTLNGNGLLPQSLLARRREQVFTHSDRTWNRLTQAALEGRLDLAERTSITLSAYRRVLRGRSLNGDLNEEFAGGPWDGVGPYGAGMNHRIASRQQATGVAMQWNSEADAGHHLSFGGALDTAGIRFGQTAEVGSLDATRGVVGHGEIEDENALRATIRTFGLHAVGTVVLRPELQFTASVRYNAGRVQMRDLLVLEPPNLDGDHRYTSLNPSLGFTWQIMSGLTAYAGAGQSNRMPTPLELGCADPRHPCTLPNALASDPHLEQVFARTLEAGTRGVSGDWRWQAGVFRTDNRNDLLFVGTSTSAGYFTNFGRTRREGVELSLAGRWKMLAWRVQFSRLRASFRDAACLLAADNSTRGSAAACTQREQDDEIRVNPGDRLPGVPAYLTTATFDWQALPWLSVGTEIRGVSRQFARGNENNLHRAGTATDGFGTVRAFGGDGRAPGYFVTGFEMEARVGERWSLQLRVTNLFDRRYSTAAALAGNPFADDGSFVADSAAWRRETFLAPAAPRAFWLSLCYAGGSSERSR